MLDTFYIIVHRSKSLFIQFNCNLAVTVGIYLNFIVDPLCGVCVVLVQHDMLQVLN